MPNERITENLVREKLRSLNYYSYKNDILVEEQKSIVAEVQKRLKNAGKGGNGGRGQPEFIVTSEEHPDMVIVIECKAEPSKHASENLDRPKDFAVDGVIHYAKHLSRSYNVISIAVSGQSEIDLKISTYLYPKNSYKATPLKNEFNKPIEEVLEFSEYIKHASFNSEVEWNRYDDLMAFSREIHDFMRDHASLTESQKPLLVGGTLIALRNRIFAKTYKDFEDPVDLQKEWMRVIKLEIEKAEIPEAKKDNMAQPYSSIAVHPELGKSKIGYPRGVLYHLINQLNLRVWPFVSVYTNIDVVGQFYGEFLKYTGGDKKALGIVLTPRHITEIFSLISGVNKNSKVLDICTGTGSFLISGMQKMLKESVSEIERENILKNNLIGVEQQPEMFALAASNMILRGDGKANLYQGSCFDKAITESIKNHKCDIGMINPPYSQGDSDLSELRFIQHMLSCLDTGGIGVAIVPMSCAISPDPIREQILKKHTLDAVMSMPEDLFYPVGTVTCIMVFRAHVPHEVSNRKTWFGNWKKDGFIKTKKLGRVDQEGDWEDIRDRWVRSYLNREVSPGESVSKTVGPEDEWCAEAYMETDYSGFTRDDLEQEVKKFALFKLMLDLRNSARPLSTSSSIDQTAWRPFRLGDLFDIQKGKRLTKANMMLGNTPYIGASDKNNGVTRWINNDPIHSSGTITVAYNGSVAEAFYQPIDFWASDDINVLYPNFEMSPEVALFICAIIRQEKSKFSYGRKWHLKRMEASKISLPALSNGLPDVHTMANLIKENPFSSAMNVAV